MRYAGFFRVGVHSTQRKKHGRIKFIVLRNICSLFTIFRELPVTDLSSVYSNRFVQSGTTHGRTDYRFRIVYPLSHPKHTKSSNSGQFKNVIFLLNLTSMQLAWSDLIVFTRLFCTCTWVAGSHNNPIKQPFAGNPFFARKFDCGLPQRRHVKTSGRL